MLTMPTAYGAEFRQDVIYVARKGGAPLAQIAKDFGLSVTTLKRWIAIAERKESGAGPAAAESAVPTQRRRRRIGEPKHHRHLRPIRPRELTVSSRLMLDMAA
jgi:transposase